MPPARLLKACWLAHRRNGARYAPISAMAGGISPANPFVPLGEPLPRRTLPARPELRIPPPRRRRLPAKRTPPRSHRRHPHPDQPAMRRHRPPVPLQRPHRIPAPIRPPVMHVIQRALKRPLMSIQAPRVHHPAPGLDRRILPGPRRRIRPPQQPPRRPVITHRQRIPFIPHPARMPADARPRG